MTGFLASIKNIEEAKKVYSSTIDIIDLYDSDTGILYYNVSPPTSIYESYLLEAVINGATYTIIDQASITYDEIALPENIQMGPNWS